MILFINLAERPLCFVKKGGLLRVLFELHNEFIDFLLGQVRLLCPNFGKLLLAPLEHHAFEAPDHDNGQDYTLVFVSLELSPQTFRRFPYLACKIVELRFVKRQRHYNLCSDFEPFRLILINQRELLLPLIKPYLFTNCIFPLLS